MLCYMAYGTRSICSAMIASSRYPKGSVKAFSGGYLTAFGRRTTASRLAENDDNGSRKASRTGGIKAAFCRREAHHS
jgi:hypothetical protein